MTMHILHVVGARPNFMKAAPVMRALASFDGLRQTLVHTGQHYDTNMSEVFFQQLDIPEPDINLGAGSGSQTWQIAQVMNSFESVALESKPDLVLVYGDVNSTVATALACAKMSIPVGHVEAGLRSFDRTMPEEMNRLLTDQIADLLFTPSKDADENLMREGISREKIHLVGNVMIDSLVHLLPKALDRWSIRRSTLNFERFGLVTLHRPSNVDHPEKIYSIMNTLADIGDLLPLVFPVHPRTRQRLQDLKLLNQNSQVHLQEPQGYLDFLGLQSHATLVITDSGGIQEETTYLDVPCLTVRHNTERPVTLTLGTNILVGQDMDRLKKEVRRILSGDRKQGQKIPFWDGQAARRIADSIVSWSFRS
ncbi:MAG TPA: UDP-N-acetylglucosamine 2-epimerase (non-hydrolyzing) [Thermodesulfobacteriota bacterium]|nr:UDP-N-acetylglucosamine 2-epimerase (non-hydrolyzing) [Thermodesulfobacteriota bacterium]